MAFDSNDLLTLSSKKSFCLSDLIIGLDARVLVHWFVKTFIESTAFQRLFFSRAWRLCQMGKKYRKVEPLMPEGSSFEKKKHEI